MTYFVRITVSARKRQTNVFLLPVESEADIKRSVKLWKDNGWNVDVDKTPFPGKGINASDIK